MDRRQLLLGSLAAAGLAPLPWQAFAQNATQPITLWGPPVGASVLLAIAAQNPTLQAQFPGLNAQVWRDPNALRVGLVNQTMPLSVVPSYVAANFANQGHDVGLVNIMTFGLLYLMAKEEVKLTELGDVVGKRVVMPFKQDMPDLVFRALLRKAGIEASKVDITYTQAPQEAMLMLITGKADVALLPEPAATLATIKDSTVKRKLSVQSLWGQIMGGKPRIPQAGLLVTRRFYEEHQDFLKAVQKPFIQAQELVKADPAKAATIAAPVVKLPEPVLQKALPWANLTVENATDIEDEILAFFDVLYQLNPKILGGKPASKALFWKMP